MSNRNTSEPTTTLSPLASRSICRLALAAATLALATTMALLAPQQAQAVPTRTDLGLVQSDATVSTATFTWDTASSGYTSQVVRYKSASESGYTYEEIDISATSFTAPVSSGDEYCYFTVYQGGENLTADYTIGSGTVFDTEKGYPFDSSKMKKPTIYGGGGAWRADEDLCLTIYYSEAQTGTQTVVYSKSGKKLCTYTAAYSGYTAQHHFDNTAGKIVKARSRSYIELSSGETLYGTWSSWARFAPLASVKKISSASKSKVKVKFKKISGATRYIVRYAYGKKNPNYSKLKWKTKSVSKSKNTVKLKKKGKYLYVQVLTVSKINGKTVKAKKSNWEGAIKAYKG